jgi:nicotinate (nicotinamide) nucleotide adenylyltransferase
MFPGAFNPPHYGHVTSVEIALRQIPFDEVWIVPSGKREDKMISISYDDRRNLGNLLVACLQSKIDVPVKLVTDELDNIYEKRTHEILRELRSQDDVSVTQLIGLDGYLSIEKSDDEQFIVMQRPGYTLPKDVADDKNVVFLKGDVLDISSTQIRAMSRNGNFQYREFVPESVIDYIVEHKLYQSK